LNNDIGRGVVQLGERRIALADVAAPVLLVGGPSDVITPGGRRAGGHPNPQWRTVGALRNGPGQPPRHPRRADRARHHMDIRG
jgi:hypothetical protein